jgi:hypothetical protein
LPLTTYFILQPTKMSPFGTFTMYQFDRPISPDDKIPIDSLLDNVRRCQS